MGQASSERQPRLNRGREGGSLGNDACPRFYRASLGDIGMQVQTTVVQCIQMAFHLTRVDLAGL